jgi:hypothetical protein
MLECLVFFGGLACVRMRVWICASTCERMYVCMRASAYVPTKLPLKIQIQPKNLSKAGFGAELLVLIGTGSKPAPVGGQIGAELLVFASCNGLAASGSLALVVAAYRL